VRTVFALLAVVLMRSLIVPIPTPPPLAQAVERFFSELKLYLRQKPRRNKSPYYIHPSSCIALEKMDKFQSPQARAMRVFSCSFLIKHIIPIFGR